MPDTIAAPATPPGRGAIAIVRASGPHVRSIAQQLFVSKQPLSPRTLVYGTVVDEAGNPIDRAMAVLAHAPRSYTGEDTLEFHVHGSPVIVREVLRAMLASGARYARPGEFTRRAFLNGKLDLHAASSVADVIDAEHRGAAQAALANLDGALATEVRRLRAQLGGLLEEIAASIDYPDEVPDPNPLRVRATLEATAAALEHLLREAEFGKLAREGVDVAIVGPPNAGKSSLLNALLGEERALVSEIPGTTRDTIEEAIAIEGVLVRLTDTAGLRSGDDAVERAGIKRAQRAITTARLLLVVIDGAQPLSNEALRVLGDTRARDRVVLFNKSDLGDEGFRHRGEAERDAIFGSVRDRATLQRLRDAIAGSVWHGETPDLQRPHLVSLHEVNAVAGTLESLTHAQRTLDAKMPFDLLAPDLQEAYGALGQLTGESVTEELLTGIFSRFCVGK